MHIYKTRYFEPRLGVLHNFVKFPGFGFRKYTRKKGGDANFRFQQSIYTKYDSRLPLSKRSFSVNTKNPGVLGFYTYVVYHEMSEDDCRRAIELVRGGYSLEEAFYETDSFANEIRVAELDNPPAKYTNLQVLDCRDSLRNCKEKVTLLGASLPDDFEFDPNDFAETWQCFWAYAALLVPHLKAVTGFWVKLADSLPTDHPISQLCAILGRMDMDMKSYIGDRVQDYLTVPESLAETPI